MQTYEYKIVPAPTRGLKGKGVKGVEGRFAHGLESAINALAAEGWEYQRSEILPSEERQGLTSSQTVYRSVLVFRRALATEPSHSPEAQQTTDPAPASTEIDSTSDDLEDAIPSEADLSEEEDPNPRMQQRALNSLYPSSDNSKQD